MYKYFKHLWQGSEGLNSSGPFWHSTLCEGPARGRDSCCCWRADDRPSRVITTSATMTPGLPGFPSRPLEHTLLQLPSHPLGMRFFSRWNGERFLGTEALLVPSSRAAVKSDNPTQPPQSRCAPKLPVPSCSTPAQPCFPREALPAAEQPALMMQEAPLPLPRAHTKHISVRIFVWPALAYSFHS